MLSDEMQAREQAVQQTGEFAPVYRIFASPSDASLKRCKKQECNSLKRAGEQLPGPKGADSVR